MGAPRVDSLTAEDTRQSRPDLADLRIQTIRMGLLAVLVLVAVWFFLAIFGFDYRDDRQFGLIALLAILLGSASLIYRYNPGLSAYALIVGLLITGIAALKTLPDMVVAPWLSLIVLMAGMLINWRFAMLMTLILTIILIFLSIPSLDLIVLSVSFNAILLNWITLITSWLLFRPILTALDWSWDSYAITISKIAEARERQAELAQISKSLSESYYHLEQLNNELELARTSAQEARQLKAQFAAYVSHELRTPLNLIIGFCEMMVISSSNAYSQPLPSCYRDDIEIIYRNASHISTLIDDILDLSQIDADRMALYREWASISQIVQESAALIEGLFRKRNLALRITLDSELPLLYIDATRIRQILMNLLSNAAAATERGSVTLAARIVRSRAGVGSTIRISVADTGPGIASEDLSRIFEEYRRVEINHHRGGNGLGLAISKRFAELHGGTMWAESVIGHGTTFYIELPVDSDVQPALDDSAWRRIHRINSPHTKHLRSVLVIDNGEVARLFARYLDGFHVITASDFSLARQTINEMRARKEPAVSAIILGATEDDPSHFSSTELPHEFGSLPVISCELSSPLRIIQAQGAVDCLPKPITRDRLRAALRRVSGAIETALIVDDDPEMTKLLDRMLRSLITGCRVQVADDGEAALCYLGDHRPDLVIVDWLMPKMNGLQVVETIRSDPRTSEIPVLIITGLGLEGAPTVATMLSITRPGGLTISEMMRWVSGGFGSPHYPQNYDRELPQGTPE